MWKSSKDDGVRLLVKNLGRDDGPTFYSVLSSKATHSKPRCTCNPLQSFSRVQKDCEVHEPSPAKESLTRIICSRIMFFVFHFPPQLKWDITFHPPLGLASSLAYWPTSTRAWLYINCNIPVPALNIVHFMLGCYSSPLLLLSIHPCSPM